MGSQLAPPMLTIDPEIQDSIEKCQLSHLGPYACWYWMYSSAWKVCLTTLIVCHRIPWKQLNVSAELWWFRKSTLDLISQRYPFYKTKYDVKKKMQHELKLKIQFVYFVMWGRQEHIMWVILVTICPHSLYRRAEISSMYATGQSFPTL